MQFSRYFYRKLSLSSTTLIAIVALYFTVILNYPFYKSVLKLNPFTGNPEDYFLLAINLTTYYKLI